MKSLETVQKTIRVFQIITTVAFVLSVVGASVCGVVLLCVISWHSGGQVFGIFGVPVTAVVSEGEWAQAAAVLITDGVLLTTEAVLLSSTCRYFRNEQLDGTPFTEEGAQYLRRLGIRFIYMPIAAIVMVSVVLVLLGVEMGGELSSLPSIVTGVVLIIASCIFRYGADLENRENTNSMLLIESSEQ